jgi:16S rRNA G1207 methylase RsmC
MPSKRTRRRVRPFPELLQTVANKLKPPFGVILGSPGEVADLVPALPDGDVTCYQMDLFQANRLSEALQTRGKAAHVAAHADLWDLPADLQTLVYAVPYGGERSLKLDMIEQAFHVLKPHGTLIVMSPYERDDFFQSALKKVFGKVHTPMDGGNAVFWCSREGERPRRRHEMTYHVRADAETSLSFVSRPGVFGYGFYDEGGRALIEAVELHPDQRILDLGCGVGTNGILAARQLGPGGHVTFADSNLRAIALAELNAKALGVAHFDTLASHTLTELPRASYDAVLANPPYYAQGTIMALFVERSQQALKRGGELYLVTKQVDAVWPIVNQHFPEPELYENRGYVIFRTKKV